MSSDEPISQSTFVDEGDSPESPMWIPAPTDEREESGTSVSEKMSRWLDVPDTPLCECCGAEVEKRHGTKYHKTCIECSRAGCWAGSSECGQKSLSHYDGGIQPHSVKDMEVVNE